MATAHAGPKPRATGFTSISPFPGRPIAGSKACLRAGVSCSRSACPARSSRIRRLGRATAARRSGSNGAATPRRAPAISTALFVCAEGAKSSEADPEEVERLRAAFEASGRAYVRSLIFWKRPALSDRCWFAGKDWLCLETKRHDLSEPRLAGAGAEGAHSVRGTRSTRLQPGETPKKFFQRRRRRRASAAVGIVPNGRGGLWPAAARRSGPGHANTFASLQMIQERWASRPRRACHMAESCRLRSADRPADCALPASRSRQCGRHPAGSRRPAHSVEGRFLIPPSATAPMIVRPQIAIRASRPSARGSFCAWSSACEMLVSRPPAGRAW